MNGATRAAMLWHTDMIQTICNDSVSDTEAAKHIKQSMWMLVNEDGANVINMMAAIALSQVDFDAIVDTYRSN